MAEIFSVFGWKWFFSPLQVTIWVCLFYDNICSLIILLKCTTIQEIKFCLCFSLLSYYNEIQLITPLRVKQLHWMDLHFIELSSASSCTKIKNRYFQSMYFKCDVRKWKINFDWCTVFLKKIIIKVSWLYCRFGKYRKASRKKRDIQMPPSKDNYHNHFSTYLSSLCVLFFKNWNHNTYIVWLNKSIHLRILSL